MNSLNVRTWLILALGLSVLAGCQTPPRLFGPQGTIQNQQREAAVFDPYADNDLGPAVEGGRPRDFQRQAPEPVRSRWFSSLWQ